jgi:hypothetical protein
MPQNKKYCDFVKKIFFFCFFRRETEFKGRNKKKMEAESKAIPKLNVLPKSTHKRSYIKYVDEMRDEIRKAKNHKWMKNKRVKISGVDVIIDPESSLNRSNVRPIALRQLNASVSVVSNNNSIDTIANSVAVSVVPLSTFLSTAHRTVLVDNDNGRTSPIGTGTVTTTTSVFNDVLHPIMSLIEQKNNEQKITKSTKPKTKPKTKTENKNKTTEKDSGIVPSNRRVTRQMRSSKQQSYAPITPNLYIIVGSKTPTNRRRLKNLKTKRQK